MLERILPHRGLKCVCIFWHKDKPPKQKFFSDFDDAREYIDTRDESGDVVYIAQASYADTGGKPNRKATSTVAVRSFWLDIDCGPTKPFATQAEGGAALKKFCDETGLPLPEVVNSGNGLYAHWCLTEDISPSQWKGVATLFKDVIDAYEFKVDQSRTSDLASVLRPIGTHNRKDKSNPKPVKWLTENKNLPPISFEDFASIVEAAAKAKKITSTVSAAPKTNTDINSEFQIYDDTPNSDAELIADKCQQIDIMRKTQGDIEEPLWYACIGVLRHTVQSPQIIHDWSCGHPGYTVEETTQKIEQHTKPPTTCAFFGQLNARGCLGCAYKNKVKSPILLGRVVQAIEAVAGVEPPKPFIRAQDGLYAPIDDVNTCFYRNDLYVDAVSFDQSLGYEVVTIKHHLPQEGWMECKVRTSDLTDVKSAMRALFDSHVTVVGQREKKLMTAYLESYTDRLKKERKIKQLLCQMGWNEQDGQLQFVLGAKTFLPDGTVSPISLAQNIPESAKAFHAKGELPEWIDTTTILGEPGMEPLAFAFLATGFGAPLMRFTGYAGAMVSMLGPSGVGKTLVGRWALSMYGEPDTLIMHKDDTRNALIGRLGVYNTLPLYIDEVTNIEGDALSELAYRITQGRDRVRQNSNAVEKSNINQWNTLALVSSNSSLIDKLSSHKLDAGAEMNRVFEFKVDHHPALDREAATRIYRTISNNYGVAGQEYIRYLVAHIDNHADQIDKIVKMIDKATGAASEERFWSAVAGCAIYGGLVAQKLGLIDFKVKPLLQWAIDQIKEMRGEKDTNRMDSVSIIGQFIDEHLHNTLVVKRGQIVSEPRGPMFMRRDTESPLLLINRNRVKEWSEKKYGSYSTVKAELSKLGALVTTEKRKTLGAGTHLAGAQVVCWVLDLSCPALGAVAAKLVETEAQKLAKLSLIEDLNVPHAGLQ